MDNSIDLEVKVDTINKYRKFLDNILYEMAMTSGVPSELICENTDITYHNPVGNITFRLNK